MRRERGIVFRIGAETTLRVEVIAEKLSSRWRSLTYAETCRALLLVGLARLREPAAKPLLPLRELRLRAQETPGPGASKVTVVLDAQTKRRGQTFRRRLSTQTRRISTAAALRTLVLIGVAYAETLPAEGLGETLVRSVKPVTSRPSAPPAGDAS